jgi:hypothetical protein
MLISFSLKIIEIYASLDNSRMADTTPHGVYSTKDEEENKANIYIKKKTLHPDTIAFAGVAVLFAFSLTFPPPAILGRALDLYFS